MSYEVTDVEFVPAIGLYRRAVAMAAQAEARAQQYVATNSGERRMREIDAVMETIILAHAAAEGWIYSAYRQAGVQATRSGWRDCWKQAPSVIAGPGSRQLDCATVETLEWLSAWRNYLSHDDDRARARIAKFVRPGTERNQLIAPLARKVIDRVDAAFTDLGAVIGYRTSSAPHSDYLWVSHDEK